MTVIDVVIVIAAAVAVAGLGWYFFGPRRAHTAEVSGGVQATVRITIEREGADKPVAIVDAIARYLS